MTASSQDNEGSTPHPRRVVRAPRAVPSAPRLPKLPHHGIGAYRSRNYCACGAKLKSGACPRCTT